MMTKNPITMVLNATQCGSSTQVQGAQKSKGLCHAMGLSLVVEVLWVLRENSLGMGKATKLYWILLKCESSINVLRTLAVMTN